MVGNSFLKGMNQKQAEAIQTTEGPLLVMAGAGSGKTRVLTHRIAYLIDEKEVNPWNILAITFTNKAANEMKERVQQLLGDESEGVWISTFHSMCVRILRRNIDLIGYQKNFTIIDAGEARTLMKRIFKEENINTKQYNERAVLGTISQAKNEMVDAKTYAAKASNPYEETVAVCYKRYQKELRRSESVDFDDLIMLTTRLFKECPDVLSAYQQKFQYIHVDEYQDTNHAQYVLVNMLAKRFENLCVVGDSDQSIYGWRGADMQNILDFEKDYPNAHVVLLEQNYRSTKQILNAANRVIEKNDNRKPKKLWTDNEDGEKITYFHAPTDYKEVTYIVERIKEKIEEGYSYKDIAILYRTNTQSRLVEETLIKSTIPYHIVGGQKFYERKETRDILAYLNVLANPRDDISFNRIVNVPKRGIGNASLEKVREFALENQLSLFEALDSAALSLIAIRGRAYNALEHFYQMMIDLQKFAETATITELIERLLEQSGYLEELRAQQTLEAANRIDNLEEFLSVTKKFDERYDNGDVDMDDNESRLEAFLNEVSLVTDTEDEDNQEQVTLMTLHSAKGLEFPIVFLIGMEEGIFPLSRSTEDEEALEEERRLAYVGITRAEQKLYLTNASARTLYGQTQHNRPSRFIHEMDDTSIIEYYEEPQSVIQEMQPWNKRNVAQQPNTTKRSISAPVRSQKQDSGADQLEWRTGDRLKHRKWGVGTVVSIHGEGEEIELDVAFPQQGVKRLLAKYAPIEKE